MSLSSVSNKISKTILVDGQQARCEMYYESGNADDYRGYVDNVYVFVDIHAKRKTLGFSQRVWRGSSEKVYTEVKKSLYDKMDNITTKWLSKKGFTNPDTWGR